MNEPPKAKRPRIPQTEVLQWLADNHPALHAVAEIDRNWVWLPVDLRADEATRKSIKDYGFSFAKRGHLLSSGKTGTWGHSCTAPIPFKRKGSGVSSRIVAKHGIEDNGEPVTDTVEDEAAAFLASV